MKMSEHFDLSTDEQVWVVLRVRQGLMSMEDALDYVRKQHEHAHEPPGTGNNNSIRSVRSNSEVRKSTTLKQRHVSSKEVSEAATNEKNSQSHLQSPTANRNRFNSLFKPFVKQKSEDDINSNNVTENGRPRSVFASLSTESRAEKKAELLDLMVAQGKITKDDRLDLLKKYGTAENYRAGDTQRKILAFLVKTSKISIDDAVHYSRLLGIVGSAETEARTIAEINNAFQEKRIYNFGVYKYYRHRASQRRILQIDFQSDQICNIQKGNLNRKFDFGSVNDYESEEGLKFFIYFRDHNEYELEADTLEEKEKICRLLQLIIENNKSKAGNHVARSKDIHSHVTKCQKVIQEGFLEKKNHSLYTTWTRRWVRIRKGELSYYKPDDENQQALNIVQLSKEVNIIKKLGSNGFSIATRKKVYQFRIISSGSKGKDIELQRDEWFKAVQYACGYHRESISGFNDDVFAKETTISPSEVIDQSYQHNINLTLRSFYTEIDKLQSMMGINELKDDANRSLVVLKQIVQGLEGFITHPPPGNSRMSCGSLSSNNESVSDQSRLSLGQRWSTDTTDSGRHHGGGDMGSPTRIVSDSLFQRSSFIEGALEPVMEMNNENGLTPVDEMDNGMLGGDGKRSSETPGVPPPLPLTENGSTLPERPPSRTPPPPPSSPPLGTGDITIPSYCFQPINVQAPNSDRIAGWEELLISNTVSPLLKKRLRDANQAGPTAPLVPPPLPVRKNEVAIQADLPPIMETNRFSAISEGWEPAPPVPPRNHSFGSRSGIVKKKYLHTKNKTSGATGGRKFWRPFKSKSSSSVNKLGLNPNPVPPPLPPRKQTGQPTFKEQLLAKMPAWQSKRRSSSSSDKGGQLSAVDMEPPPLPPPLSPNAVDGGVVVSGGPAVATPPPPPPPPPPPLMAPQVKRVFKVTSKIKMKPFHWTRVPNNHYSKSLWKNARDLTEVIDTDQLEMLYSDTKLKDGPDPDTSKTKLKSILDPKVAQNLGIFLAGFKMEVEEVKHRLTILRESEGGLSPEHIADLRKYHPNAEDMEAYKQFKDKPQELAPTDQFMMHFCEIPLLKTRLDLLFFASELPIKFEDLVPTIDNALAGCRALIFSQKFTAILEYILAIGNFINSGSSKGTAPGFRLLSLPKLVDCKGKDKKFTLMKYLVQQIHQIDSELLDFTDELLPITFVPEASVKALQAEVEVMKKDLMLVRRNANVLLSGENPPERDVLFCDDVESFAEQLDLKLGEMQFKTDEMKKLYDDILVRYGEPVGTESGEVFLAVSDFIKAFKREADLILVTTRGFQRRKSKHLASRQPSCKSSARDSAVESYTSLDQSDSAGSDLEQLDENMEHSSNGHLSSFRKSFDKKRFGGSKRRREIKNTSKRQATYKRLPDNPTKEGYLDKLSNQKTPLSSQWNRRYFELTAQGYLYYSKRKNEKNVESIYLRGCPIALEDDRVILIQTEERSYKLRATSHDDAKEWVECMLVYTLKRANLSTRKYSAPPSIGQLLHN